MSNSQPVDFEQPTPNTTISWFAKIADRLPWIRRRRERCLRIEADAEDIIETSSWFAKIAGRLPWIRRRRERCLRIEADAKDLIERFGAQAYYEASQLSKGYGVSKGDRSREHWARVKIEIARRHPIDLGLSGYVRWE